MDASVCQFSTLISRIIKFDPHVICSVLVISENDQGRVQNSVKHVKWSFLQKQAFYMSDWVLSALLDTFRLPSDSSPAEP